MLWDARIDMNKIKEESNCYYRMVLFGHFSSLYKSWESIPLSFQIVITAKIIFKLL